MTRVTWECGVCRLVGIATTNDAALAALARHVNRFHPDEGRSGVRSLVRIRGEEADAVAHDPQ